MRLTTRIVSCAIVALTLQACDSSDSISGSDATTKDTTIGDTVAADDVLLGSGSGASFTPGQLTVGLDSLSAGGQTYVTASLADSAGNLYTAESVSVSFSSSCSGQNLAILTSPVSTHGGIAESNYQAAGCSGADTIMATATVGGVELTATGQVTVAPATVGSLEFVSASPTLIGIKGTGLTETSTVVFRVVDLNGHPVAGQEVNFTLDTTTGGITLSAASDISTSDGTVRAYVNSGTVAGAVRVTAAYAGNPAIATHANSLVISTGIADQNSFSLSTEIHNPEAWDYDGEKVEITIHAADHFNNPVADGTAAYFTTEGGQINPLCTTLGGACSVTWTSSEPRPSDGRVTILATMVGNESFVDLNGNGIFDGEDTFTDLAEAFRDDNESATDRDLNTGYDVGVEEFRDFNGNGFRDPGDGQYNGVLCGQHNSVACSPDKSVHVRRDLVLVMSGSRPVITFKDAPRIVVGLEPVVSWVEISDERGQTMPYGTKIDIATTNGSLLGTSSFEVGSTNAPGPTRYEFVIKGDDTPDTGLLTVTVTTPKNNGGSAYIWVQD